MRLREWRADRGTAYRLAVVGVATLLLAALAGAPDSGPSPALDFKLGIIAQDQEKWELSVTLMSRAATSQREDGTKVRIYGMRYVPYLPLYYLGLAHFQLQDCAAALAAWQRSLAAGAVQGTKEEKELENLSAQCHGQDAAHAPSR